MDKVFGKVYVGHGHIALAGVDLQRGVAAGAVLVQVVQAQGLQRGALLPVDLLALAAVAVVADAAPCVLNVLQVRFLVAGVGVDVGVQHDDVGEGQHLVVGGLVHGIAPLAVGVVLLHLVLVGALVVDEAGLVGLAVDDLDILAVRDNRAILIAVGTVQAVGQVAGRAQAVIHKVKEGGVVGAVHIHILAADIICDVVGVGVHRVLQRQRTGVVALAGPVDAAIIAVAVGTVVVVQLAVVVVDGVLLHDDGLALMDIERLPGQNQAEELVAARADGADLADGLIIGKDRHETGDAALDLDLKQDVGLGQTALGAGRHDVVDHHGGDALALGVVSTLRLTGQDVGLIGGQLGGSGGRLHSRGCAFRGGGRDGIAALFAGRQQHCQGEQRCDHKQNTFHSIAPFQVFLL